MSDSTEREIEASEAALGRECAVRIDAIRASLAAEGEEDCLDCGRPIPERRRRALPSAERCVPCQIKFERYYS